MDTSLGSRVQVVQLCSLGQPHLGANIPTHMSWTLLCQLAHSEPASALQKVIPAPPLPGPAPSRALPSHPTQLAVRPSRWQAAICPAPRKSCAPHTLTVLQAGRHCGPCGCHLCSRGAGCGGQAGPPQRWSQATSSPHPRPPSALKQPLTTGWFALCQDLRGVMNGRWARGPVHWPSCPAGLI